MQGHSIILVTPAIQRGENIVMKTKYGECKHRGTHTVVFESIVGSDYNTSPPVLRNDENSMIDS